MWERWEVLMPRLDRRVWLESLHISLEARLSERATRGRESYLNSLSGLLRSRTHPSPHVALLFPLPATASLIRSISSIPNLI